MTTEETSLRKSVFPKQTRRFALRHGAMLGALLVAMAWFQCGCAERRARAATWSRTPLAHPRVPAPPVQTGDPEAPELLAELPPAPRLANSSSVPPKPRGPSSVVTNSEPDPEGERPAAPLISPRLTPAEQSAAQRQTEGSLRAAAQDLQATLGRTLSPTQADLAEKVRAFIGQAREAGRAGDWPRARNLAHKAQLLAKELAGSLQ